MAKRQLDDSWKGWLLENIERQCDPEELVGILIQNHFSPESIRGCMGNYYPTRLSLAGVLGEKPDGIDHKAIAEVRLTRPDKCAHAKRFPSDIVQLYTLGDFMSGDECDAIAGIMSQSLRASTITQAAEPDKYYRSNSTSDLALLRNKTVEALDEKITRTLGIRPSYSEGIQGQYYAVGQEFKQHTDFFEPDTEEFVKYGSGRGNRTWTFMVYLNDVPKGGGTYFMNLGYTFQPQKGKAVVWNNFYADGEPNYNTIHAGMRVEEGHKAIVTKWFRERGTGPMFYPD